jgi:polar amino acid transport system substrate-binding protein
MKNKLILAVLAILLITLLSTLPFILASNDQSLENLQKKDTIRIGYAIEAPYAFVTADGTVSGESPEVAKKVSEMLGIHHIEWRQIEFSNLINSLHSGEIDVIAAGMFITAERAQRVNFSEPTFHVQQGLLVFKGNPLGIHSYQQAISSTNAKIAVISDAVEETWLRQLGMPQQRLIFVPDALTGYTSVETGVANGLALSSPTLNWMALQQQLKNTEIAAPFEQTQINQQQHQGFGAFAFRKEDRQLLEAWNVKLKDFIGSSEHLTLINRFGFSAAELPGTTSTQEILSTP